MEKERGGAGGGGYYVHQIGDAPPSTLRSDVLNNRVSLFRYFHNFLKNFDRSLYQINHKSEFKLDDVISNLKTTEIPETSTTIATTESYETTETEANIIKTKEGTPDPYS